MRSAISSKRSGVSRMKLISLNVARPRLIVYQGKTINTGIFKEPVAGPVQLRTLNLDGDRQADLTVHGGPNKAVYGYPSEHYPFWHEELPATTLAWGMFGEQLRTLNLDGDRQADLTVHGGPNKAVYGYPSEHYPFWHEELPGRSEEHTS